MDFSKAIGRRGAGMSLRIACVALALLAGGAAAAQEIGIVKSAAGEVSIMRGDVASNAAAGDAIRRGDVVRTGEDGAFGGVLSDGTAVSLGRDSEIAFARYAFEPGEGFYELLLRAFRGRLVVRSGLIGEAAPETIRVETPKLMIGVRGTRFAVVVPDETAE